jgi:hypothetical protein
MEPRSSAAANRGRLTAAPWQDGIQKALEAARAASAPLRTHEAGAEILQGLDGSCGILKESAHIG